MPVFHKEHKTEKQEQQQNQLIARTALLAHTEQGIFVADPALITNEICSDTHACKSQPSQISNLSPGAT